MKSSIDGGDVHDSVCYILIYGFSHRVGAATWHLSSAQVLKLPTGNNFRTEPMNEEITDWIVNVTAIGTTFHFKRPFYLLILTHICNAPWKIQFCKIEISILTSYLKVKINLKQATKAQRGSRGIALLFLWPQR